MYFKQILAKQNIILLLCIMAIVYLFTASASAQQTNELATVASSKKILTVYFSRTGNTEQIAKQIHGLVGGDIFEVRPATPYPGDYDATTVQAKKEKEAKYNPPLTANMDNLQTYDVIFIGYPVWWRSIPPPIRTFLVENNLAGKTIIPFCTHAGSGKAQSTDDIIELAPTASVLETLVLQGSRAKTAQPEVKVWLTKIGMLSDK